MIPQHTHKALYKDAEEQQHNSKKMTRCGWAPFGLIGNCRWRALLPPGGICSRRNLRSGSPWSDDDENLCHSLSCGHCFGVGTDWRGQEVERCCIYHIKNGGSQRHGAMEYRRWRWVDGCAQAGGIFWRRGSGDGSWAWQGQCKDPS